MFSNWPQYAVKKGENLKLIYFYFLKREKDQSLFKKKKKL